MPAFLSSIQLISFSIASISSMRYIPSNTPHALLTRCEPPAKIFFAFVSTSTLFLLLGIDETRRSFRRLHFTAYEDGHFDWTRCGGLKPWGTAWLEEQTHHQCCFQWRQICIITVMERRPFTTFSFSKITSYLAAHAFECDAGMK